MSSGVTAAAAVLLMAPLAAGKGIAFSIQTSPETPRVGEPVRITVRAASEVPGERPPACQGMRVLAVSPAVGVREALRVVEGARVARPIHPWVAFRLKSLRRVDDATWVARLRPNRAGNWTLVIPNFCAPGYVTPEGVFRKDLAVAGSSM